LSEALQAGLDEFGRLDIVVANAGIAPMAAGDDGWRDVIDVSLAGVHHTVDVAIPIMIAGHRRRRRVDQLGGWLGSCRRGQRRRDRIRRGKAWCVGLMRVYANVLARHNIRVNSIHPSAVHTPMIDNEYTRRWASELPTNGSNALPVQMIAPEDIANAIVWLVSDAAPTSPA
jgi:NAD(P)-dependent dehydrogenase (short-subunit alcohol dehydrogenase family)